MKTLNMVIVVSTRDGVKAHTKTVEVGNGTDVSNEVKNFVNTFSHYESGEIISFSHTVF